MIIFEKSYGDLVYIDTNPTVYRSITDTYWLYDKHSVSNSDDEHLFIVDGIIGYEVCIDIEIDKYKVMNIFMTFFSDFCSVEISSNNYHTFIGINNAMDKIFDFLSTFLKGQLILRLDFFKIEKIINAYKVIFDFNKETEVFVWGL